MARKLPILWRKFKVFFLRRAARKVVLIATRVILTYCSFITAYHLSEGVLHELDFAYSVIYWVSVSILILDIWWYKTFFKDLRKLMRKLQLAYLVLVVFNGYQYFSEHGTLTAGVANAISLEFLLEFLKHLFFHLI